MQHPIDTNDPQVFATAKENQYFDRKSARKDADEIAKHIIAFANFAGGKLVVGIEDDGEITGFKREKAHDLEDFRQAAIVCCEPSPRVEYAEVPVVNSNGDDDVILVIDIEPSAERVITRRRDKAVFLRQNDKSVVLDREQVIALEYDKNQRRYEDEIADRSSIEDVDSEVMTRYKAALGTNLPDEQVLRSRGFLVDGRLTNAGVLLFAEYPPKFLPWARVRVLRYDGVGRETGRRLNIVKDRTFDGPIPKVLDGVKAMVSEQLRDFQSLGDDGLFQVVPEYPEFAWLEGVVNAVTHRNYGYSGDYIRVSIFDDRMEIQSPGKLPNLVTLENLRHTRWSRNPVIARTLVELGWVRELNEGIDRIYGDMDACLLNPPTFSEPNNASVMLTLENSISSRMLWRGGSLEEVVGADALEALNEYEIVAVQLAMAHGRVTTKGLADRTGKGSKLCSRTLRGLADKQILAWHGTAPNDPSQHYTLAK